MQVADLWLAGYVGDTEADRPSMFAGKSNNGAIEQDGGEQKSLGRGEVDFESSESIISISGTGV